jgi:hypothetical protein
LSAVSELPFFLVAVLGVQRVEMGGKAMLAFSSDVKQANVRMLDSK